MDKLLRDTAVLEQFDLTDAGLEKFSLASRTSDFVRYYFTRFLFNLRDAFKGFSRSELDHYNVRHQSQLAQTFKNPVLKLSDVIVPIPKGMIKSYEDTLHALIGLLADIGATSLDDDLRRIISAIEQSDSRLLYKPIYTKAKYDKARGAVGKLYSTSGLTHLPGNKALDTLKVAASVNDILTSVVINYYPVTIDIGVLVNKIEKIHTGDQIKPEEAGHFQEVLMDAAWRVSIFAVVLDHVQKMEHSFVEALETLRKAVDKL